MSGGPAVRETARATEGFEGRQRRSFEFSPGAPIQPTGRVMSTSAGSHCVVFSHLGGLASETPMAVVPDHPASEARPVTRRLFDGAGGLGGALTPGVPWGFLKGPHVPGACQSSWIRTFVCGRWLPARPPVRVDADQHHKPCATTNLPAGHSPKAPREQDSVLSSKGAAANA